MASVTSGQPTPARLRQHNLNNYSWPDGPLQDDVFQATGLRGVDAQGQTLWEEIHYRDVRNLQA